MMASLRPRNCTYMLFMAFGESWKEPDCHVEGYVFHDDFYARIAIDDKIGA